MAALTIKNLPDTLSAQLKQLESSLGVMLFERQHKKLVLTDQGRGAFWKTRRQGDAETPGFPDRRVVLRRPLRFSPTKYLR